MVKTPIVTNTSTITVTTPQTTSIPATTPTTSLIASKQQTNSAANESNIKNSTQTQQTKPAPTTTTTAPYTNQVTVTKNEQSQDLTDSIITTLSQISNLTKQTSTVDTKKLVEEIQQQPSAAAVISSLTSNAQLIKLIDASNSLSDIIVSPPTPSTLTLATASTKAIDYYLKAPPPQIPDQSLFNQFDSKKPLLVTK